MHHSAAFPFVLRRSEQVAGLKETTSTKEKVHGLLRLEGDSLSFQWQVVRVTDHIRWGRTHTDRELGSIGDAEVPLSSIASAEVRWSWLRWPPGPFLILTATDLRAFESIAGEGVLRLSHPAELAIRVGSAARGSAREFASELEAALADRKLRALQESELEGGGLEAMGRHPKLERGSAEH